MVAASSWGVAGLAIKPLYQSYQRQQQVTTDAAHELRSPLASLLATVEAVLRLDPSYQQDAVDMLQTVERQGRHFSHLVSDLLLLTSLEQDHTPTFQKPCCLNDPIADLAEEFSELAASAIHLSKLNNLLVSEDMAEKMLLEGETCWHHLGWWALAMPQTTTLPKRKKLSFEQYLLLPYGGRRTEFVDEEVIEVAELWQQLRC